MRRREFIGTVAGAALTLPIAARAQQSAAPIVAFLRSTGSSGSAHLVAAMRRGLGEIGWIEGQNITIVERYGNGDRTLLQSHAAELVRRGASVIVANTSAAIVAKNITVTLPIVLVTGSDPVQAGLVGSFNRPGGNVTGVIFPTGELTGKRLGLLHELVPPTDSISALLATNAPAFKAELRDLEQSGRILGRKIDVVTVSDAHELADGIATIVKTGARAIFVGGGPLFLAQRAQLVALTARHNLPAIYVTRQYTDAGGLMSYGPSQTDSYRQAGLYAGRILKGEKPADLPVMQSSKFELVINLKTAKTLGLAVPASMQLLADEVIE